MTTSSASDPPSISQLQHTNTDANANANSESNSTTPKPAQQPRGTAIPTIRYLDTTAAYDLWSAVYDTDGNFLQALDTIEMETLLPDFLSQITPPSPLSGNLKFVDLGCGTGRNTLALLQHVPSGSTVVGLDASAKMLEVARERVDAEIARIRTSEGERAIEVHFGIDDMIQDDSSEIRVAALEAAAEADAVISTLVLEHVPIRVFLQTAFRMLKPGGLLLVTNMHAEMGQISQAGFVDPNTGEKIRPKSYAHAVTDVVLEARRQGFEVVGEILERAVDDSMSKVLGERARKWIGVTVWFGMVLRKV